MKKTAFILAALGLILAGCSVRNEPSPENEKQTRPAAPAEQTKAAPIQLLADKKATHGKYYVPVSVAWDVGSASQPGSAISYNIKVRSLRTLSNVVVRVRLHPMLRVTGGNIEHRAETIQAGETITISGQVTPTRKARYWLAVDVQARLDGRRVSMVRLHNFGDGVAAGGDSRSANTEIFKPSGGKNGYSEAGGRTTVRRP